MRSPALFAGIVFLPVALIAGACGQFGGQPHESVGKVGTGVDPAGIQAVLVRAGAGSIKLTEAAAGAPIRIDAEIFFRGGETALGRRADLAQDLRIETKDGQLTVADAHLGNPDHNNWQVRLTLAVPAGLDLDLSTGAGDCEAVVAARRIMADVGAGSIKITATTLVEAKLKTGAGDATLVAGGSTLSKVDADLGVGVLHLEIPTAFEGSVELSVGVGNIVANGAPEVAVKREVTSSTARGQLGKGAGSISGKVGTGTIRFVRK